MQSPNLRFLRLPEVIALTGLSRSSVYLHVRHGTFPAPVKLGKRAVGWPSVDVDSWLQQQMTRRAA